MQRERKMSFALAAISTLLPEELFVPKARYFSSAF
jgi:hypothetical protein